MRLAMTTDQKMAPAAKTLKGQKRPIEQLKSQSHRLTA
jgi:hypothetical protein